MRSLIIVILFLFSCRNLENNELIIDLNLLKSIQSLEQNSSKSEGDLYMHVYQSTCSVCFVKLMEWEKKFTNAELNRENHYFILIGGGEEIVKYHIIEKSMIYSNIYYSDNEEFYKLFNGSFKVQKENNKILLINKVDFKL